jgi:hypothetical protein
MSEEVITEQDAPARKEQHVATIREQRLGEGLEEGIKQWHYYVSTFQDGRAAAAYLNAPPAQGPGEAMTTVRADGRVEVFAYLPATFEPVV